MTFWGVVLIIIGLLLLGLGIVAMVDIFAPKTPMESYGFKETSGWTKFFWGLVLVIGGFAVVGLGASKTSSSKQAQFFAWEKTVERGDGSTTATAAYTQMP